jgi:hypothetical protein
MCKNMTRTSLFNLTYLDIDILGDTSERSSRVSSFYCKQILPGFPFAACLRMTNGGIAAGLPLLLI